VIQAIDPVQFTSPQSIFGLHSWHSVSFVGPQAFGFSSSVGIVHSKIINFFSKVVR